MFHQSCTSAHRWFHHSWESTTLILNSFFPLDPNQPPTSNNTNWQRHFPRLIAVVSVTKAHVSTRLVWCFPDLTVTLGSLEKIKQKGRTKFQYPPYFTYQFIHYTYFAMLCDHGLAPDTKMLAQTQIQYSLNTKWYRIFEMICTYAENK